MRVFHLVLLLVSVFFVSGSTAKELPVHFLAGTDRKNPALGRVDSLALEVLNIPADQIANVLSEIKSILPLEKNIPFRVPFYLSRNRPLLESEFLVSLVLQQLSSVFPNVSFQPQIYFLEEKATTVQEVAGQVDERLNYLENISEADEKWKLAIEQLKLANQKILNETLAQQFNSPTLRDNLKKPSFVKRFIHRLAGVKASINFITRGGQLAAAGLQGGLPLLAGIALLALDPAIEFYATRLEYEIGVAFTQHGLPIPSKHHPFLKKISEFYKHNYYSQFTKGTVASTVVWGVMRPAGLQQLGHWSNPQGIPSVSWNDIEEMAGAGLTTSILYFAGFQGFERLRQKGWLSKPAMDLLLRVGGILWQGMEILFSIGRPDAKAFLPVFIFPLWTLYTGGFLIDAFLPARHKPFAVIDPLLNLRNEIDEIGGTESTMQVSQKATELFDTVKKIEALPRLSEHRPFLQRCAAWLIGTRLP